MTFRAPWRLLFTLTLLGASSAAFAQCARGPRTAEVTLPNLFAVYYQQFRSDAASDTAEFYGGVCVTGVGGEWTVMAERVLVVDLSSNVHLEAPQPTLFLEGWRMSGALLVADATSLSLTAASLSGPDVSGSAGTLDIDLTSGSFTLTDLVLTGSAFEVVGALATLQGDVLTVDDAGVTTCVGVEQPPLAIESNVATVGLTSREVTLDGGTLRVGTLRIPLKEKLTLSDTTLSELQFPVKVAVVEPPTATSTPTPGAGLSVRVVGIPLADGVTLEVGATGLDPEQPLLPVALLRITGGEAPVTAAATFGLEAGAPYLDVGLSTPLEPWLRATLTARSGAAPARRARHEGRAALEATTRVPAINGSVTAEVFAAVTAITANAAAATPDVAGPRLGASVGVTAATPAGMLPLGSLSVESRFQVTHYPVVWGATATVAEATQWGVRLAPTWRLTSGPLALTLGYDARFTNAASPFGSAVDGLTPLQRATLTGSLTGALGGGLSGRLGLGVTYDAIATPSLPAGFKRLRADGQLELDAQPWTVTLTTGLEAAGLVNALPNVKAFATADVAVRRFGWPVIGTHVPFGAFEFGIGAEYDLLGLSLTRLETRLGVPAAFDTLELRPFVAVDFAQVLQGGSPSLSGYGLDLTFVTCCGSFTVGALNDRGNWGASIGVDLERRPGVAGGATPPTAPAAVVSGEAPEGNEAEPGIMPTTP